ncbi:MAG: NAAT family transporter [Azonexus sp.]|jgi:multiple antibiotic resistance protein|nr:NAAT family transporter [Azonexus sp.]
MSNWYAWLNMLVGLIVIVNPLLGVSSITTLASDETSEQRRATARMAALTVGVVMSISAIAGEAVLALFGIGIPEFHVGGGILLLLIAVSMLNARMSGVRHTAAESEEAQMREQVGVVPIGIPLLAGPGAISTAILYAHKGKGWLDMVVLLGEIWLVAALVWIALLMGDRLMTILGQTGMNIASRIMGLLLAAIAVGFVTQGLKVLLPGLA